MSKKRKTSIQPLPNDVLAALRRLQEYHASNFKVLEPLTALTWMTEELGELARAIRYSDSENQIEELGQMFMWCISLANSLEVDIAETVELCVLMYKEKFG